jgi:Ino eighty subunit 2
MKKDEHARKRKELTKRKVQEEKNAALNRLVSQGKLLQVLSLTRLQLKPQASKARGAAPKPETLLALEKAGEGPIEEEAVEKPNPLYTRWISTKNGVRLGVPDEWLGKQAGRMFGPPRAPTNGNLPPSNGALVQELPVE